MAMQTGVILKFYSEYWWIRNMNQGFQAYRFHNIDSIVFYVRNSI